MLLATTVAVGFLFLAGATIAYRAGYCRGFTDAEGIWKKCAENLQVINSELCAEADRFREEVKRL